MTATGQITKPMKRNEIDTIDVNAFYISFVYQRKDYTLATALLPIYWKWFDEMETAIQIDVLFLHQDNWVEQENADAPGVDKPGFDLFNTLGKILKPEQWENYMLN